MPNMVKHQCPILLYPCEENNILTTNAHLLSLVNTQRHSNIKLPVVVVPDSKRCASEGVEGVGAGTEQISVGWSRYSSCSTVESCIESSTSVVGQVQ